MSSLTCSKGIHIRRPQATDLPHLLEVEDECFGSYYQVHRFSRSQFLAYMRSDRAIFYVAACGALLIGYIAGYAPTRGASCSARIESVAVAARERRKGVGSRLMRRFMTEARRRGCRRVTSEVAVANEESLRFFTRREFSLFQQLPAYYSPKHAAVRVRLAL